MSPDSSSLKELWEKLHEEACARDQEFYTDPETGYLVGTRLRLLRRGHCCESGCRHCPYGFDKNKKSLTKNN